MPGRCGPSGGDGGVPIPSPVACPCLALALPDASRGGVSKPPDHMPITLMGLNVKRAFGLHQGGQEDSRFTCLIADRTKRLRSIGQAIAEKLSRTAIEVSASSDIGVCGHHSPFPEPSGLCRPDDLHSDYSTHPRVFTV